MTDHQLNRFQRDAIPMLARVGIEATPSGNWLRVDGDTVMTMQGVHALLMKHPHSMTFTESEWNAIDRALAVAAGYYDQKDPAEAALLRAIMDCIGDRHGARDDVETEETEETEEPPQEGRAIALGFSLDNAAFDDCEPEEAATVLREIALRVAAGDQRGTIFDLNGNTVGVWAIGGTR